MQNEITSSDLPPLESTGFDLDRIRESPERKRVLVIEDEPNTLALLKKLMMRSGYDVAGAKNGQEGVQKCLFTNPDLILLDLLMPVMDGWETLEALRKITSVPVVIVSAISSKELVVRGLQQGAWDYISKPYHPDELVARVNRILETYNASRQTKGLFFPKVDLHIDLQSNEVVYKGRLIHLTPRVFNLLAALAEQAPRVVNNSDIANRVWGVDSAKHQNRIKNLIFVLRREIEENHEEPKLVLSRGGVGYRLATEGDTEE